MKRQRINVIGAGLAGSEAAYQLLKRGFEVHLFEMRSQKMTPAHTSGRFAELVCSNSLRSDVITNAVGLLKEEMRICDSLIMKAADETRLPAGSALAVDREAFSGKVEHKLMGFEHLVVHREEVTSLDFEDVTIVATGPLTSDTLSSAIKKILNDDDFYFFDAVAPIVERESIDFSKAYYKSRYDKGNSQDYINCPMTKDEFDAFYDALILAETAKLHGFENEKVFEGCMPFEVMAKRGRKTLLFGPMKPVGLEHEGMKPYAVVQLRQDNVSASLYNIVGFQTHLTWPEQRHILQMIPGLENVKIVRYGVMHRNSFLNSPQHLNEHYQLKSNSKLFFAGQMSGVEGYVESAASGLLAALNAARVAQDKVILPLSRQTMIQAMAYYVSHASKKNFQPMNANFGILESISKDKQAVAEHAIATLEEWMDEYEKLS